MKEDEIHKALWIYYGVVIEERRYAEMQKIRLFTSSIMCMALLLTYMGFVMSQTDKIVFSSNWITIGIVFIGIILFLFFISFIGYFLSMRIYNKNLFNVARVIERIQQDILFDKIKTQEELQERFEAVHLFYSKRE